MLYGEVTEYHEIPTLANVIKAVISQKGVCLVGESFPHPAGRLCTLPYPPNSKINPSLGICTPQYNTIGIYKIDFGVYGTWDPLGGCNVLP